MFNRVKNMLPPWLKAILKPKYHAYERFVLRKRRFMRKLIGSRSKIEHKLSILCIKRTAYADMAIDNVNSLHAFNPNHSFLILCDDICEKYISENMDRFDYPNKVALKNLFKVTNDPWQHVKIEAIIYSSRDGRVLVDADTLWHADLNFDTDAMLFQALPHKYGAIPNEVKLINNLFHNPALLDLNHYVNGLSYIPGRLMSEEVANDIRRFNRMIYDDKLAFINTEPERLEIKRLSEEIAVTMALQMHYPNEKKAVLKKTDGWGNKEIMQALFYGCGNKINS